jgi:plastocyanin
VAITIQNYGFLPQTVTVPVGTTVTWTNLDTVQHQIANSATPTIGPELLFKSKILGNSDSFSFTFTGAGTYQYICILHPFMRGTIFVTQ